MINGTNPLLAKLYNWLARNRSSVGYTVGQTIHPIANVADLWPKTPIIRKSTLVLPIGGSDTIVLWDGVADGARQGGPYHCMTHRFNVNVAVVAVAFTATFYLSDPDAGIIMVIFNGPLLAGNTPLELRDVYIPARWTLAADGHGTLGDTIDFYEEMSIAPTVEPLPRGI